MIFRVDEVDDEYVIENRDEFFEQTQCKFKLEDLLEFNADETHTTEPKYLTSKE